MRPGNILALVNKNFTIYKRRLAGKSSTNNNVQLCQKSISSNNHLRFYIRSCYWRQWTLYVCLLLDLVIDDNKYFRFYFRSCYWRQWTLDVCLLRQQNLRFYIRSCYWWQWTLDVCLLSDLVIGDNKHYAYMEYSWLALLGTNNHIGSVPSQRLCLYDFFLNKELIPLVIDDSEH